MPTTLQQSSSPTLDLDCAPSRSSSDEEGNEDEIDRYYNMKVGGNVDPVEWWIGNRARFLKLSQMALDVLAIPAMAADCERSFSIAKLTLSSQRHAMKWEAIEMLQMLKNWLRNGDIVIGGVMMGSSPGWGSIKGQQDTMAQYKKSDNQVKVKLAPGELYCRWPAHDGGLCIVDSQFSTEFNLRAHIRKHKLDGHPVSIKHRRIGANSVEDITVAAKFYTDIRRNVEAAGEPGGSPSVPIVTPSKL
ncbi:hypothetical protein CHGG_10669 [Chaetomium globosum CBS 148.51]|uniref:HAT C-terminal dimerisation domain-containing protein n=1 Tax=Chaetomium globosum (strain ATCC 6205 / CBS 148.51 / DSM 1962 / NBRC 6347 / NRRL 1970) TaxID=306901 RepID=Q2GMY5_CHAGB|nr:uncharacterized protein CHGG_10669 [Chaetomium globosum CBS 148.51]EAQ84265.1 hypothetical protein CHGG_10669 [Chaetomium globosum CBS 148.51]